MLAAVDPSDTAKLDEIDARVWCWLNNYEFLYMEPMNVMRIDFHARSTENGQGYRNPTHNVPLCTRSRDALKAIRPEGWVFGLAYRPTNGEWVFGSFKPESIGKATWIDDNWDDFSEGKTEELAELGAVIQAIAYERAHP